MTHLRAGRLLLPLCLLALTPGIHPLLAQTAVGPAPPVGLTPSELYRDVQVLDMVSELELTEKQVAKIIPIIRKVARQLVADRAADEQAYQSVAGSANQVIASLVAGRDPSRGDLRAFDDAAAERTEREEFRIGLARQAAADIQRTLTAEQVSRIETAAEMQVRHATQARLEGADTPLDYVLMKLDGQMQLMPDEYVRTRQARALQMAEAILGPRAPRIRDLATALLGIMNEVAGWNAQQYQTRRATLKDDIRQALGLSEEPPDRPIKHDAFIAWITSERAPEVLETWLIMRAAERAPEEPAGREMP